MWRYGVGLLATIVGGVVLLVLGLLGLHAVNREEVRDEEREY